ncbi:MAG: DUF5615 family PIN-like protein [Bacteroidetes bacterium]|nr:DUF5615 family PIN-like protein [Bacteroidota bacterium]MCW5894063.1 DUF5615 family PIN-like protein [Bacteroidota bacterium]
MKLILDQHLSFRLLSRLDHAFAESKHVRDFDLTTADDEDLWQFALEHGFAIVSKDSDFLHRSIVRGHPSKVIFLRIGNSPSNVIANILNANKDRILAFENDHIESMLILSK